MSGAGLAQLVQEIKLASANIRTADDETRRQIRAIEESVNDLYRKVGRPGGFSDDRDTDERKSAIELCRVQKSLIAEGDASMADYMPGSAEIQTAMRARQGLKALFRRPGHAVEHGVNGALDWHSDVAVKPADQELADFARPPMRLVALQVDDQVFDLLGQLVRVAHRPARAVGQRETRSQGGRSPGRHYRHLER
jgi:hypothetical protein